MAAGHRGLPGHDHHRAALLEVDLGGALQQVLGQPDRDAGAGRRAGRHDRPCPRPGTSRCSARRRGRRRASSPGRRRSRSRPSQAARSSFQCASRNGRPVSSRMVSRAARDTTRSTASPASSSPRRHGRRVGRAGGSGDPDHPGFARMRPQPAWSDRRRRCRAPRRRPSGPASARARGGHPATRRPDMLPAGYSRGTHLRGTEAR